jgi:hypothetical protein
MSQDQLLSLAEERLRRQKTVDYGIASAELSSFQIDPSTRERARPYVEGQLAWHEFCDLQR